MNYSAGKDGPLVACRWEGKPQLAAQGFWSHVEWDLMGRVKVLSKMAVTAHPASRHRPIHYFGKLLRNPSLPPSWGAGFGSSWRAFDEANPSIAGTDGPLVMPS